MARLPYVAADITEPAELVGAIRARRGGRLLNLDRMLLHSPALAAGWNAYLRAVRNELSLDPLLRELAMCAVASLNGAEYEFIHHAPEFAAAGGTQAQVDALRHPESAHGDVFEPRSAVALQLTIEMTRQVRVADETITAVRSALGETATVELVAVIAAYNMVSRFLVALGVEPEG